VGIIHERAEVVVSGVSAGGRAFQERREPIHGGFAQTSLFATILKSPPPNRDSAEALPFMNNAPIGVGLVE